MGEEAAEAAPGPDLGPEEHTIKVYLSGNSGNKEVRENMNKSTFMQNKMKFDDGEFSYLSYIGIYFLNNKYLFLKVIFLHPTCFVRRKLKPIEIRSSCITILQ